MSFLSLRLLLSMLLKMLCLKRQYHEWESRQNQKIERLLKQAAFRQKARVEEVRFKLAHNLDRNIFKRLATLNFLKRKENLIITGVSGVGKSYLAQVLGHQDCFDGLKTLYTNTARLFAGMKLAKPDETYLKELQVAENKPAYPR